MIEEIKQYLQQHDLPIEWLAIQTGLPKRTVLELLSGKKKLTEKYRQRFVRVLEREENEQ